MLQETFEQLLDRAAAAFGVESEYWDIWGHRHAVSADTRQALLAAMGVPSNTPEELEAALAKRDQKEWGRLLPPSIVVSREGPHKLPVSVPAELLRERAQLTIHREDGSTETVALRLCDHPQIASREVDGRKFVRKELPLPGDWPLGYHEISLYVGVLNERTRYIVTPDRAWSHPHIAEGGRVAGVAISLYGLRSERNWGCGDFTDLEGVLEWVAGGLEASFVGLNPLHAIHNRRPYNTSPYLPNCIFYQNFLYLDVERIEDYPLCRRAVQLRQSADVVAEIENLRAEPFVEYERVSALKLRFLKLLFARFLREWRTGSPRVQDFRTYIAEQGELLERYSTYCALDEYLHKRDLQAWVWSDWPEEYRDPGSSQTRAFRAKHWRSVLFYQYLQWQIDRQLEHAQQKARDLGLAIGLYHDLALATDRFGADLWAHRPFYIRTCRVGSPPDDFAPGGQDWGFPPPDSEHHRENGYQLFAESIRKNCRHGGALRIDHVMRLFRLYWIPEEATAAGGAYVRELSDHYLRVLALESVRNHVMLIGEDLGTVEPAIRETLARFGVMSYRLFYFEQRDGHFRRSEEYPHQALVSSTTHDLPTLAGFWKATDIEARRQAGTLDETVYPEKLAARAAEKQKMLNLLLDEGLLPPELSRSAEDYPELTAELHNAIIGVLAHTPSALLAINQEDLTKEVEQQNLPGTTWQYPNWQRKMRFTLEQLRSDPQAVDYTEMFRNWIIRSGRANPE